MKQEDSGGRTAEKLVRRAERAARRPTRAARRRNRGQTLIIFVLLFTALIGFMGLAIDTVRVYDLYARMQRAAESGALAGVIYMPNNYNVNIIQAPYDNAVCRALQATSKNGFGQYCNPSSQPAIVTSMPCSSSAAKASLEVVVCPIPGSTHALQEYITESINLLFLGSVGVGPITLTVDASAEYIPPVDVAVDPTSSGGTGSWGTFGECGKQGASASAACTGNGSRNWTGNINGPGELKEQGDPLVSCAEGPDGPPGIDDPYPTQNYTTYTGLPTNHPQTATTPTGCTNPDNPVFTGPISANPTYSSFTRAGYAYYISVTKGSGDQNLWIWNAPFSPETPKNCNGRTGGQSIASYDIFYEYNCAGSGGLPYKYYPGTACGGQDPYTCTDPATGLPDPKLYFTVTYSLYLIQDPTQPASSQQLQATWTELPYEVGDYSNCTYQIASPAYAGTINGCVTTPCVAAWCPMPSGATVPGQVIGDTSALTAPEFTLKDGASYRLQVVTADYGDPDNFHLGWGGHAYSIKLCPTGATQSNVQRCTPSTGPTPVAAGWTQSDAVFIFPGGGSGGTSTSQTTEYPLGVIGPEYAGRTLDIRLYDQGDLHGNNTSATGTTMYAVAPPPPPGVSDPCSVTSADLQAAGYSPSSFIIPSTERTVQFAPALALPAIEGSLNGDQIYNGLWVDEQIAVPTTYTAGPWTLCAIAPQTNDADVLGISVQALGASPVHLI